jgi:hypothetical protein
MTETLTGLDCESLVSPYTSVSKDLQQRRLAEAASMADHQARNR